MINTRLVSLLCLAIPCKATMSPGNATVLHFPWTDIVKETGVDPKDVVSQPPSASNQTFACKGDGPNPLDCPQTIEEWARMGDQGGFINVDAASCTAITKACCEAIVCAPTSKVHVRPDEVTGRMWSPLTMKCVFGGGGGIWYDAAAGVYVQMLQPRKC